MDIPIQRVPSMAGPAPAAAIPRMDDPPNGGNTYFSLDGENEQKEDVENENKDSETDTTELSPEEAERERKENAVAPAADDEAGRNLNVII